MKILGLFLLILGLSSCKHEFEPVQFGSDACTYCKMTIIDKKYACEMINSKGKIFKFDDLVCMRNFISENKLSEEDKLLFVADFIGGKPDFLDAKKSLYLHDGYFKSPMNGNYAAYSSSDAARSLKDSLGLSLLTWKCLQ